jgi:hypothetical protein
MQKYRLEPEEYRNLLSELDRSRKIKHDALISDLNIINRYLFKKYGKEIPEGGLFFGNVERFYDRETIADWAGKVYEIFVRKEEVNEKEKEIMESKIK